MSRFSVALLREDGRVVVEAEAGRGIEPAPVGNVAVFDDDVVAAVDADRADDSFRSVVGRARPVEREAAQDHVGGVDRDARVVLVAHVDRRALAVIDAVAVGRAGLGDRQRRVAVAHADRLAHRETPRSRSWR